VGIIVEFTLRNDAPTAVSVEGHHGHHVADVGLQPAVLLGISLDQVCQQALFWGQIGQ
jgi:hypothetical protein